LKKPRVGVHCRVNNEHPKYHSKSLRGTTGRNMTFTGLSFLSRVKIRIMMKITFMASIPSIALRR
jgi:hypothetical protein